MKPDKSTWLRLVILKNSHDSQATSNDSEYPLDKSQFHIRDYKQADYECLAELWRITGLDYPERGDDPSTIDECHRQGGKLLVMLDRSSGKLIGSSWMTCDGRRIFMHHFGIHPDYQRQGLGRMLLMESLKFIKQKGKQVKLEVHKENQAARHLYESAGFFAFTDYDIYMIRNSGEIEI